MPDLSKLDPLIPQLMSAVIILRGDLLSERERKYIRVVVRLTDKALNEYNIVRDYILAQLKEMQRSADDMSRNGRKMYFLGIVNHMENCINATRRLFGLLEAVKSERNRGLTIDRNLRKKIESNLHNVKNIRNSVEHIDGEIQRDEMSGPITLILSDDDKGVEIGEFSLEFEELAHLLKLFHELSVQWIADFCRKSL